MRWLRSRWKKQAQARRTQVRSTGRRRGCGSGEGRARARRTQVRARESERGRGGRRTQARRSDAGAGAVVGTQTQAWTRAGGRLQARARARSPAGTHGRGVSSKSGASAGFDTHAAHRRSRRAIRRGQAMLYKASSAPAARGGRARRPAAQLVQGVMGRLVPAVARGGGRQQREARGLCARMHGRPRDRRSRAWASGRSGHPARRIACVGYPPWSMLRVQSAECDARRARRKRAPHAGAEEALRPISSRGCRHSARARG